MTSCDPSLSHVGHMQVSQVPVRNEPDSEGEINYPFVFQTLISLGYKKWIGCEYIPRGVSVCLRVMLSLLILYGACIVKCVLSF